MVTSYILILGFSAWLIAVLLLYVAKRFGKLFGNSQLISAGFVALLPLLGFLVVVAAPAPMLVGCVLLAGSHLTRADGSLPVIARIGVPLVAALVSIHHLELPAVAQIPPTALYALAVVVLFAYALGAERLSPRLAPTSIALSAAALTLAAAPMFGAPSFIALDLLILASVLLGAVMATSGTASVTILRQPAGFLLGWLTLAAAAGGAWIPALLSLVVYAGAIALTSARPSSELVTHGS